MTTENTKTEKGVIGTRINHVEIRVRPAYMNAKRYFFWNLFPSTPAEMVPKILNTPITPKATAPRAAVVVIPNLAKRPFASIEAHISVTNAGKCAVMNPS